MASEQAKDLRKRGIAAAKAGEKDQARQLLQQSLRIDPGSEAGWLWLATVAKDQREKMVCLYKLLEINPNNEVGLQSLQQLGLTWDDLAQQFGGKSAAKSPSQTPSTVASRQPEAMPPVQQAPGVPVPDAGRLAQAQSEAEAIAREYLAPLDGYSDIQWVRKNKGRAGERDAAVLRLYMAGGAVGILALLLVIGFVVVSNNPELRGIVFAPTWTLSPTPVPPTLTFTPTAGVTPTASPTPALTYTPSPTVPPEIVNGAQAALRSTEIYPPALEKGIRDSIGLIDAGQYEVAIPTLVVEVTRVSNTFDPAPYYYQAIALVKNGQVDAAAQVMAEAERRLTDTTSPPVRALVDTGMAYVELAQAEQFISARQRDSATSLLSTVEDRAENAIKADPRLEQAYLLLARRYALDRSFDLALGVLDQGLGVADLRSSINLIVQKGEIYFSQREFDLAAYQAYLALYIDPATEPAHLLQIRTALATGQAGLAVLNAQAYLFYYPGSVRGYQLLGDARVVEGNFDLALEAYNQGLAGGEDNPLAAELLTARAALYERQGRYEQARQDLTSAFNLTRDPAIQARRMMAAYNAGNRATAERDAGDLLGQGIVSDDEIRLLQARILIDEANGTTDYQEALDLLSNISNLAEGMQPIANEYRARAQYNLGAYDDALNLVNRALQTGETGGRYYLRGLILEAQGKTEAALRDYDWVLTLSAIYPYRFLPDVRERAEALQENLADSR